jgi:hypothetical protein
VSLRTVNSTALAWVRIPSSVQIICRDAFGFCDTVSIVTFKSERNLCAWTNASRH